MEMNLNFTPELFKKFQERYNEAVEKKEQDFTFAGQMVLTSYAKYVVEMLEPKFNKLNNIIK